MPAYRFQLPSDENGRNPRRQETRMLNNYLLLAALGELRPFALPWHPISSVGQEAEVQCLGYAENLPPHFDFMYSLLPSAFVSCSETLPW